MANIHKTTIIYIGSVLAATVAAGCSEPGPLDEEQIAQDVITSCNVSFVPATAIDFDRELVIRDPYVVEDGMSGIASDHCRTTWTNLSSSCPTTSRGRWTFGWMMAAMAGTSDVTTVTAKHFVRDWLKKWLTTQQPNPSSPSIAPRTAITETLINPWLSVSKCPPGSTLDTCDLDLTQAPFRLLAFVNRIDLPTTPGYSQGGEFRVVFGAQGFNLHCADPPCGSNQPLQATVILEYNLPLPRSLINWANQLHALSSTNPHSTSIIPPDTVTQTVKYRTQLQTITDLIVGPFAVPFSVSINGSAISHIRTNEIAFDANDFDDDETTLAQWEFRQFKLGGSTGTTGAPLVQDPVAQTPDSSTNHPSSSSTLIDNILIGRASAILGGDPAFLSTDSTLFGNASQTHFGAQAIIWEVGVLTSTNDPGTTSYQRAQTRHQFGLGTCVGCHYFETGNQLGVFHVANRLPGAISPISNFLSAGSTTPLAPDPMNTTQPAARYPVNDPTNPSNVFLYNEPWRRACEIRRILSGSTTPATKATGHLTM
jgi:hypothetical protein